MWTERSLPDFNSSYTLERLTFRCSATSGILYNSLSFMASSICIGHHRPMELRMRLAIAGVHVRRSQLSAVS